MLIVDHVDFGYLHVAVVALFSCETQVTFIHAAQLMR